MDSVAQGLENLDLSDHAGLDDTNHDLDTGGLVDEEVINNRAPNNSDDAPGLITSRLGPNSVSWEVMNCLPAPFLQDYPSPETFPLWKFPRYEPFNPNLSSEFRELIRLERRSDSERHLCQVCGQYDWRWLFSRVTLMEELEILMYPELDLKLNLHKYSGERPVPQGENVDFVADRPPFPGIYFHDEELFTKFLLSSFPEILSRKEDCSLCDLIVRSTTALYPAISARFSELPLGMDLTEPLEVWCDPISSLGGGSNDQSEQDDLIMFVWIPHDNTTVPLTFTWWKGGLVDETYRLTDEILKPDQIDSTILTSWLDECKYDHASCPGPFSDPQWTPNRDVDFTLRVIDVETNHVVVAPKTERCGLGSLHGGSTDSDQIRRFELYLGPGFDLEVNEATPCQPRFGKYQFIIEAGLSPIKSRRTPIDNPRRLISR